MNSLRAETTKWRNTLGTSLRNQTQEVWKQTPTQKGATTLAIMTLNKTTVKILTVSITRVITKVAKIKTVAQWQQALCNVSIMTVIKMKCYQFWPMRLFHPVNSLVVCRSLWLILLINWLFLNLVKHTF